MAETGSGYNEAVLSARSPIKTLIAMAAPSAAATFINGLYSLGDAFFLGKLGPEALAAVTLVFPLLAVLGGVGSAFGSGSATLISRCFGRGESGKGVAAAFTSLFSSILIGGFIAALVTMLRVPTLRFLGGTESILDSAGLYAGILLPGSVLTLVNMNLMGITRARGKPVLAMAVQSAGAVLNLILDPLFIFAAGWGIPGAAWATIISQALVSVIIISELAVSTRTARLPSGTPAQRVRTTGRILTIGAPSIFSYGLITIGAAALIRIASLFGDDVIAVSGVALRIYSFAVFPLYGIVQGFIPPAGYAFGSGNIKRLKDLIKNEAFLIAGFCGIATALVALFPVGLSKLFFSSTGLVEQSASFLRRIFLLFPILGLVLGTTALYQVTGHIRRAVAITVIRLGLLFAPLMYLFSLVYGSIGIALSQPAADILSLVVLADAVLLLRKEHIL